MPGLAGFISAKADYPEFDLKSMLDSQTYGRAEIAESYRDNHISLGCIHLGTGGQRALYESDQAVVAFFGYLTEPGIPPGDEKFGVAGAARFIHDRYLAQGDKSVQQLAGVFAFALWDKRKKILLLASDHLGLRPIYYTEHNGLFRFASEVKGILSDPSIPHHLDLAAIAEFLHFSYVMGDKTFFQDIHLLPPSSLLTYHDGHWRISKYWDFPFPSSYPHHTAQWYDELIYDSLGDAVRRMANPKVRFGLSLSGGLDSRWIAPFLAQIQPQSLSFTLGIPGSDDTSPAKAVADRVGLTNYYWEVPPTFIADLAEAHTYIVDGMYDVFNMEEFPLSVRVGQYVDVSVGGLLGDALFGHGFTPDRACLRKQDAKRYWLWRTRRAGLQESICLRVFGESKSRELEMLAMDAVEASVSSAPAERGFQVILCTSLQNTQRRHANIAQIAKLPYVDIYHPLADKNVLLTALQLPPNQLILERAYRRAMSRYFPELAAIPWTYTLTPSTIPLSAFMLKKAAQLTLGKFLEKTKLGHHSWIRQRRYYVDYDLWSRGPLRSFIEKTLLSAEALDAGLFRPEGLRTVIREHMEGKINARNFIGRALALALWSRLFYAPSVPVRPCCPSLASGSP